MKARRKMATTGAGDTSSAISDADRKAFLGKAQVQTSTAASAGPKKPRMFRFGTDDDHRLDVLVERLDAAQVRPIPTRADVVRVGLKALEQLDDKQLIELLSD